MWNSHRLRCATRRAALLFFIVITCGWGSLYLDSVCQRRRAERLLSDLKSFPIASAGFADVRDLVERNGGAAIQEFPVEQFPRFGLPFANSFGHLDMPALEDGSTTCTVQNCTFEIWILPGLSRFARGYPAKMLPLMDVLAHLGIRHWAVYSNFQVAGGKLNKSQTELGQIRGLVTLEYEVVSTANPVYGYRDYYVGLPHVTGPQTDILSAHFVQTSNPPTRRAFDVDLRCVTAILRNCSGFGELAPSAWADYQSELIKK